MGGLAQDLSCQGLVAQHLRNGPSNPACPPWALGAPKPAASQALDPSPPGLRPQLPRDVYFSFHLVRVRPHIPPAPSCL